MAWKMNPTEKDAKELKEGYLRLTEGSYHGIVTAAYAETSKGAEPKEMLVIEIETLAGTMRDCEGITHKIFVTQHEWSIKNAVKLLLAVGIVSHDEIDTAAKKGLSIDIEDCLDDIIGKELCFTLKKGKKGDFMNATFYGMDSQEADGIPKNRDGAIAAKAKEEEEKNCPF